MSAFINIEDYDASLHREILDSLTRGNDDIIEVCEDQAVAEMKGYLKSRYDVETIFRQKGGGQTSAHTHVREGHRRLPHLLRAQPDEDIRNTQVTLREGRQWLKMVSADEITIDGADLLPADTLKENSRWQIHSNPLRPTHF